MVQIEELARAALSDDGLLTRSYVQQFIRAHPRLADVAQPETNDPIVLAVAASLIELLAERTNQPSPTWTDAIQALREPIFLVKHAKKMKRLRALCESSAPAALKRRKLLAPPNYLEFA